MSKANIISTIVAQEPDWRRETRVPSFLPDGALREPEIYFEYFDGKADKLVLTYFEDINGKEPPVRIRITYYSNEVLLGQPNSSIQIAGTSVSMEESRNRGQINMAWNIRGEGTYIEALWLKHQGSPTQEMQQDAVKIARSILEAP